jgi:hypothetical protein
MDIQDILDKDPRIVEMKQQYQVLINRKNQTIIDISHIEADIIKLSGSYEILAKDIISQIQANIGKQLAKVEENPPPPEVPEEEVTTGVENPMDFESDEASEVPPSAENTRPLGTE